MNLEGKLLGNRYEIIEKIGNGGMATVYKAKCHVLNRYVAVKILRDEFTTDEEFIKRFNIEAQAAASLTHPNIVSIFDVGNEGNLYYIVMELVKGKTLKEIILEDGKLSWKWSVKVAAQIASALETAHRNNIIHRDIKPHNIIITEDGVAKVTDFGIAKAVSNSTITAFGTTIGSVHYFSPEHARGGFTDAKSDLYSLGVVLYEMVTGRVPFDADTPVSVALKHMQEEPIQPIILNPDIPVSVNDIIVKAMKKDVNERYSSATEMIKDLNMALKNPDAKFVSTDYTDATKRISLDEIEKLDNKTNNKENKKEGKFSKIKEFYEKHKVLKIVTLILVAILIFALTMGGTYFALTLGRAKEVQIPNLANLTLEQAKQEANKLNLKIEVQEEKYDIQIPEGQIISQDPKHQNNFKIKEGTTIKVIISKGQEIVIVPKVIGEKRDDAVNKLRELGLSIKIEEEYSDDVEKGYIIKQSLAENAETLSGSEIIINVSSGVEQVEVPNLSGKTENEAKTAINNAKLKWKSTDKISDSSKPNGVVVNQTISSGSMVDKNTELTITVNEFNEIKSGTITINVKSLIGYTQETELDESGNVVVKEPGRVTLKVTVNDEQVESKSVSKASTNETVRIDAKGTVVVKIFIDGNKKAEKNFNLNQTTSLSID